MCGKIKKIEEKVGEELFPVPEDGPGFDFGEALQAIEQDALDHGFDLGFPDEIESPPRPVEFPLYQRVTALGHRLDRLCDQLSVENRAVRQEESFQDLRWYSLSIRAKTYRQLCNRWYLTQGETLSDLDYHYTQYVLTEICRIVRDSLSVIFRKTRTHQHGVPTSIRHLAVLEKELLDI